MATVYFGEDVGHHRKAEADGFLFLPLPYIRDRLVREGELPVGCAPPLSCPRSHALLGWVFRHPQRVNRKSAPGLDAI